MTNKRVLVLMSRTGGGHLAAAEALRTALAHYPVTVEVVDAFAEYGRGPLRYAPQIYPHWVNWARWSYAASYRLLDSPRMAALSAHWTTPILDMRRLFDEHPADAVVCVHSLLAHPAAFALRGRAPLICVVTDIAEPPAAWFAPGSTALVMSPTAEARARSILPDERVHFIGPVVNPHFVARPYLLTDPVNVLLVGGSEGMGKIEAVAYTLDRANLPLHLTVVAGHNERLRTRLAAHTWRKPTEILGYVNDMPQRMAAAHVLVSKAGPGTIAEACAVGLPMILFDAIPAQETGNVAYVIKHGAGAWGPSPNAVVNCLDEWLRRGALPQIAAAASALATSNAVHEAATFIYSQTETRQDMLSLRAT